MQTDRKSDSGKSGAGSYHHGDLRAALVDAARDIVVHQGPAAVSLRGVAKAVGVSQTAPYHHFKDKQALLEAVAAAATRAFTATMLAHADGASDPRERLNRLGVGYVSFAVRERALFQFMQAPAFQAEDVDPDLAEARAASYAPLADAVAACLPGAGERRIKTACAAAWSLVHGMASLANDGRLDDMLDLDDLENAALSITAQLDIERAE